MLTDKLPEVLLLAAVFTSALAIIIQMQGLAVLRSGKTVGDSTAPFWMWFAAAAWLAWVLAR